jgi:hypothetical protein
VSKFRISYPIILGYLALSYDKSSVDNLPSPTLVPRSDDVLKSGNPVSINTFVDFVEKSMIFSEIEKDKVQQKIVIAKLEDQIVRKHQMLSLLQTPIDVCKEYLDAESKIKVTVNKKRKELERKMLMFRDQYRNITENCKTVKEYDELVALKTKEEQQLENIGNYIREQVKQVISILLSMGFIEQINELDEYILTQNGKLATEIGEIHPLVFIQLLNYTEDFRQFTPKQIVGVFSCFTDIKVSEDVKLGCPRSTDPLLQKTVEKMGELFNHLADCEYKKSMDTGIHYNNVLMYDLVDQIAEWCDCETEQSCKYYIQQVLGEKHISAGDFSKGILKIATIVKEVRSLCEKYGKTELQHKMATIEPMILKYITTSQSLYV